ncbi:MAG: hypothetical protein VW371_03010 [Bacteroidota bacterium]
MKIRYNISDQMYTLLNEAIKSDASKKGFGVIPTQQQFLNGVIYYWIRKNIPDLLTSFSEVPEIKEHQLLKNNRSN